MEIDEICSTKCVPGYVDDRDGKYIACDGYNESECLTGKDYKLFYNSLNWNDVKSKLEIAMNKFNRSIITNDRIMELLQNVYNDGKPFKNYGDFFFKIDSIAGKNSHKFCDDLNFSFNMPCSDPNNKGTLGMFYTLFHIAFHSEKSRYIMGKLRSNYACAYYEKKYEGDEGTSPFHYKIDNTFAPIKYTKGSSKNGWSCASAFRDESKPPPFKALLLNKTNPILFKHDYDDFTNNGNHPFSDECKELHLLLFNLFITFWNREISGDTRSRSSKSSRSPRTPRTPRTSPRKVKLTKTRRFGIWDFGLGKHKATRKRRKL